METADCRFLVDPPHRYADDQQLLHQLMMVDPAGGAGTTKGAGASGERKRRFTEEQVRSLETTFHARRAKLEPREKAELARELGLQPRQVAIWFQNKRARWRSKQLEHDYADLRARYDALRDRVDSLRREKLALAAQVDELKGRLSLGNGERRDQTSGSSTGCAASESEVDDKRNTNNTTTTTPNSVVHRLMSSQDDMAAVTASSEDSTATAAAAAAGYCDDDHVAYLPDPFCNPPELWDTWPLLEWNAVA